MKNKVLIKLMVPELDMNYDIFIPVNELIWKVKSLIMKSISDINGVTLEENVDCFLINKDTCNVYNNNEIVINTNIRNGSELFLIFKRGGLR